MNAAPIRGVITALVTPFNLDGSLDWPSYEKIIKHQIASGVDGIVPCGTTGESPTLSEEEKKKLILKAVELCRGTKTLVIAGTGGNETKSTIALSQWAAAQGVSAVLVVTPYYNKPSAAGLEAHYLAIANAVQCSVILYNVPGRTGVSLKAATISKLAQHPRIRAIKEASANLSFASEILDQCRADGTSIELISGDDATYLPLLSVGATGVISVASNLFPKEMVALQAAWDRGDVASALKIHQQFYPLFRDLFVESNPAPIKAALASQGVCGSTVRLPLTPLSSLSQTKLNASLQLCGFKL